MVDDLLADRVELGRTGIFIPRMGTGAWAWGDRFFWGYGRGYDAQEVRAAFDVSLETGIPFFDTAEVYGSGRSERFIGQFAPGGLAPDGEKLVIATKFFPFPWRLTKAQFKAALKRSLKRLQMDTVDLYQVHQPLPPVPVETWAQAMGEAIQAGLARAAGVSNYQADQTRRAHGALAKMGLPLASNQVEYSLLNRSIEFNGVMDACRELDITVIAYSPIAKGILSGKYTTTNPPGGFRARQYNREYLAQVAPLIQRLRAIGHAHDSKTPAQVAINWTICKGTVPIPGAKNARQAQENAGALGWRLTENEVAELDDLSKGLQKH